jgi:hypothetical protein
MNRHPYYLYMTSKSVLARLAHTVLKPTASINGHGAFPKIDRWSSRSCIRERTLQDRRSLRLEQALAVWRPQAGYAAGLLLKSLVDKSHQWWYFLEHPEVSPDNNRAERSLRLGVTKRKIAGGSRSLGGFVDTARLLTVIQSCRAQGRSVLTFFRQALASVHHPLNTVVSLIPTADFSLFVNP